MMQLVPTETLVWVDPKDFSLDNCSIDSSAGCFLEVHHDYSDELHDLHNDYPLVGEKINKSNRRNVVWTSNANHTR